jgi:O-antigen/teichoic acid export membrane protein
MRTGIRTSRLKIISKIFSDESLTKKASLNAIASVLDYAARLVVVFLITPMTVRFLGNYYYGTWQILTRFIGFISPTSGRPSTVLRYALAHHQSNTDNDQKRTFVGSALIAWLIFLPLVILAGGIYSWFIPQWLKIPPDSVWRIRLTAAVLVVDLAVTGIGAIPQAVMQGQNLGYKRMGLTVAIILFGGGLIWMFLELGYGILGVAIATLISTTLTAFVMVIITKAYTPWFGVSRPDRLDIGRYLGLSGWFISWDVVFKLMMVSDVIVLGFFDSVESVTSYTLTKYTPEMLITVIAMVVFGVAPGLGGIIGSKNYEKAAHIRDEIWMITWIIIASMGTTILLWNRIFMNLWVGPNQYIGALPMLLILVYVAQFVLIRVDANFIDLTLKIKQKVLLGAISVGFSLILSIIFVNYFKMGYIGVLIGIITGRSLISVGFPLIIARFLQVPLTKQLQQFARLIFVSTALLLLACYLDSIKLIFLPFAPMGWISFILFSAVTTVALFIVAIYAGLSKRQRLLLLQRARLILSITK